MQIPASFCVTSCNLAPCPSPRLHCNACDRRGAAAPTGNNDGTNNQDAKHPLNLSSLNFQNSKFVQILISSITLPLVRCACTAPVRLAHFSAEEPANWPPEILPSAGSLRPAPWRKGRLASLRIEPRKRPPLRHGNQTQCFQCFQCF